VIIPSTIRTAPHAYHPPWLGHLIVALADCSSDLICDGTRDYHYVGLSGRGAEDDTESVLVVSWHRDVHHFDGTAGEAEGEGPEGTLAGPVDDLVGCCTLVDVLVCFWGFRLLRDIQDMFNDPGALPDCGRSVRIGIRM
jgi:hypothetical protein